MLPRRHLPSFHPQIPAPTPGASDKRVQPKTLEGQNVQPWQTRSVTFKSRPAWRGGKRRESLWSTESLQRAGPAAPASSTPSSLLPCGGNAGTQLWATLLSTSQRVTGHMKKYR